MRHQLALPNFDPPLEFELDVLDLPPGGLLAELEGPGWILVLRGRVDLNIAGSRAAVRAGEFRIIPRGGALRLNGADDSRFWLFAAAPECYAALAALGLAGMALEPFVHPRPVVGSERAVLIAREGLVKLDGLCRSILAESASGQPGAVGLLSLRLLELFIQLARLAPVDDAPVLVWTIADAVAHVERHHARQFTLEELVAHCALSTSDFCRQFKAATGYPLFEFINRQRISRACALLRRTDLTVLEISQTVGYRNISFFNRYFARITGTTPRAWRNPGS